MSFLILSYILYSVFNVNNKAPYTTFVYVKAPFEILQSSIIDEKVTKILNFSLENFAFRIRK